MNRRGFLRYFWRVPIALGLASISTGCDLVDLLAENIIMSLRDFKPPRLSIDEIGWQEFLSRWSLEATELARAVTFRYGNQGYDESFANDIADELAVSVPPELYKGGLQYPPKTDEDKRRCENVLHQIKILVSASFARHGLSNDPSEDDYNILHYSEGFPYAYSGVTAYEFAALQGDMQIFPPATENDIAAAEQRLGVRLPPSYKDFLRVSNGFWVGPDCCLLPVQKIGWMRDLDPGYPSELLRTSTEEELMAYCKDRDYYHYDEFGVTAPDNDGLLCRRHKLADALLLTAPGNISVQIRQIGILPFEQGVGISEARNGEWEAFKHLAPRAKSFKHLMEHLYQKIIAEEREYLAREGKGW